MSPVFYFIAILNVYSRGVCSVFQWIAEQFINLFSYISWLIWNVLSQIIPPSRWWLPLCCLKRPPLSWPSL